MVVSNTQCEDEIKETTPLVVVRDQQLSRLRLDGESYEQE